MPRRTRSASEKMSLRSEYWPATPRTHGCEHCLVGSCSRCRCCRRTRRENQHSTPNAGWGLGVSQAHTTPTPEATTNLPPVPSTDLSHTDGTGDSRDKFQIHRPGQQRGVVAAREQPRNGLAALVPHVLCPF